MFGTKRIAELALMVQNLEHQLKSSEDVVARGKEAQAKQQAEISELKQAEFKIREEFIRKEEHAVALMKIEQEKDIHRQVSEVKDEYNQKEKELLEKNFDKLGVSLEKIHSDGNRNIQYIEKTSLKMMGIMAQLAGKKIDTSLPALEAPVATNKKEGLITIDGIDHLLIDGEEREVFTCTVEDRLWYVDDAGDECWVAEEEEEDDNNNL